MGNTNNITQAVENRSAILDKVKAQQQHQNEEMERFKKNVNVMKSIIEAQKTELDRVNMELATAHLQHGAQRQDNIDDAIKQNAEMERLKKSLTDKTLNVELLTEKLDVTTEELDDLQKLVQEKDATLVKTWEEHKTQIEAKHADTQAQKKLHDDLSQEHEALQARHAKLLEKDGATELELQNHRALSKMHDDLRGELQKLCINHQQREEDNAALKAQCDLLETELTTHKAINETHTSQHLNKDEQLDHLILELNEARDEIQKVVSANNDLHEEIRQLREVLEAHPEELSKLQGFINEKAQDHSEMKALYDELFEQHQELNFAHSNIHEDHQDAKAELERLSKTHDKNVDALFQKNEAHDDLKEKHDKLALAHNDLEQQLATKDQMIAKWKTRHENEKDSHNAIKEKHQEQLGNLDSLAQANKEIKEKLEAREAEIVHHQKDIDLHKNTINTLQDIYNDTEQEHNDLKVMHDTLLKKMNVGSAEEFEKTLNGQLDIFEKHIDEQKDHIEILKSNYTELETNYQQAQVKIADLEALVDVRDKQINAQHVHIATVEDSHGKLSNIKDLHDQKHEQLELLKETHEEAKFRNQHLENLHKTHLAEHEELQNLHDALVQKIEANASPEELIAALEESEKKCEKLVNKSEQEAQTLTADCEALAKKLDEALTEIKLRDDLVIEKDDMIKELELQCSRHLDNHVNLKALHEHLTNKLEAHQEELHNEKEVLQREVKKGEELNKSMNFAKKEHQKLQETHDELLKLFDAKHPTEFKDKLNQRFAEMDDLISKQEAELEFLRLDLKEEQAEIDEDLRQIIQQQVKDDDLGQLKKLNASMEEELGAALTISGSSAMIWALQQRLPMLESIKSKYQDYATMLLTEAGSIGTDNYTTVSKIRTNIRSVTREISNFSQTTNDLLEKLQTKSDTVNQIVQDLKTQVQNIGDKEKLQKELDEIFYFFRK